MWQEISRLYILLSSLQKRERNNMDKGMYARCKGKKNGEIKGSLSLACSVAHQIDKLYSGILYAYTRTAQFQAKRTQSSPKKGKAT